MRRASGCFELLRPRLVTKEGSGNMIECVFLRIRLGVILFSVKPPRVISFLQLVVWCGSFDTSRGINLCTPGALVAALISSLTQYGGGGAGRGGGGGRGGTGGGGGRA